MRKNEKQKEKKKNSNNGDKFVPKAEGKREKYKIKNRHQLTNKQKIFVMEYIVDFNIKRAAMCAGCTAKSAFSTGSNWLNGDNFPAIELEIRNLLEKRRKETEIDAKKVLKELASIAFINPKKLLNEDGTAKTLQQMEDDVATAINTIKHTCTEFPNGTKLYKTDVTFWNKMDALKSLAQHLGILEGTVNNTIININWDQMMIVGEDVKRILSGEKLQPQLEPKTIDTSTLLDDDFVERKILEVQTISNNSEEIEKTEGIKNIEGINLEDSE